MRKKRASLLIIFLTAIKHVTRFGNKEKPIFSGLLNISWCFQSVRLKVSLAREIDDRLGFGFFVLVWRNICKTELPFKSFLPREIIGGLSNKTWWLLEIVAIPFCYLTLYLALLVMEWGGRCLSICLAFVIPFVILPLSRGCDILK
jgi:hypothetical protein